MVSVLVLLFALADTPDTSKARTLNITLKDINAKKLLEAMNAPTFVTKLIDGKIGEIKISAVDDDFTIVCTKFYLRADPISRIEIKGNTKDNTMTAKLYMLGGLVEYKGTIPKQVQSSLPMRLLRNR